jgi:hypothetical protein
MWDIEKRTEAGVPSFMKRIEIPEKVVNRINLTSSLIGLRQLTISRFSLVIPHLSYISTL